MSARFSWRRPSPAQIDSFLRRQVGTPFSYGPQGLTRVDAGQPLPEGVRRRWKRDEGRIKLGQGELAWHAARAALERWEMFRQGWVEVCWPSANLREGTLVAILARRMGLWSLSATRIVYTYDEVGELQRFGFAYGTLPDHIERGEERFGVEWNRATGHVRFEIEAWSRPQHPLAWLAYPLVRHWQQAFARGAREAMLRAVEDPA